MTKKISSTVLLFGLLLSFFASAFLFRCVDFHSVEQPLWQGVSIRNLSDGFEHSDNVSSEVIGTAADEVRFLSETGRTDAAETIFFFTFLLFFSAIQHIAYLLYRKKILSGLNFCMLGHRCITGYIQLADGKKRRF